MHPKLFKNWTVHEGRICFHNKDQLLDSLEIDHLDSCNLVLTTELRLKALRECHDQPQLGHLGIHKTYKRLTRDYYWRGIWQDTVQYVRECET